MNLLTHIRSVKVNSLFMNYAFYTLFLFYGLNLKAQSDLLCQGNYWTEDEAVQRMAEFKSHWKTPSITKGGGVLNNIHLLFWLIIKIVFHGNHKMIVTSSFKHNIRSTRHKVGSVTF